MTTEEMARVLASLEKTSKSSIKTAPVAMAENSPEPIESVDEVIAHVKRKVDAVGVDAALCNPQFLTRMNLLRFEYSRFSPIALANNEGYLYPCSNLNAKKDNCNSCRVLKFFSSVQRFCVE